MYSYDVYFCTCILKPNIWISWIGRSTSDDDADYEDDDDIDGDDGITCPECVGLSGGMLSGERESSKEEKVELGQFWLRN